MRRPPGAAQSLLRGRFNTAPRGIIWPMKQTALVPDDLWHAIEPFLPKEPPKPKGGRPRLSDRAALAGIVVVLKSGIAWQMLPTELGCGSGSTCWRRLRDWQEAGVWERLHSTLLNWLGGEAAIDWSRASADSVSVRAKRGTSGPGRTRPTGASRAPSTTWSSTATASPWRSVSRRPTPTIRPNWSR
jgi:transposase